MNNDQAGKSGEALFADSPWSASHDGHGGICITDSEERQVGFVSNRPTQDANAALIAAAPELYEALRDLAAMHEDAVFLCGNDDESRVGVALSAAFSALAKARGEK
jgi:hypothetical protein